MFKNYHTATTSTTSTTTRAKTLWSETILDVLYSTLKSEKPDYAVTQILREVRLKGFKPAYIIAKVERKVGRQASLRVKRLLKK